MTSFGIDLGTTNSVIAMMVDGKPMPIPIDGSPIVPSVVLFQDDRVLVGKEARNLELACPERTIRSAKRRIGRNQPFTIGAPPWQVAPEEVSAHVLKALRLGAERAVGTPIQEVVVTVPAYFDDAQRRATLRAAELADLKVQRLLNEPTAASLVYEQRGDGARRPGEAEIVLVYDLGGGTFDVSVLEVFEGVREVRSTAGNTALGGDDFDELLLRRLLAEVERRHGIDLRADPVAMARLRRAAEAAKIRLSSETQVAVREEFLARAGSASVHLDTVITRRQLEDAIRPLLETTIELSRRALADARLGGQPLSRVILAGGSTRIPLVRAMLEEALGATEIREEIDPDLAVGLGAAIQAALLHGEPIERILVDVTAHSLGIRAHGCDDDDGGRPETFAPIIRRGTALPVTRAEEFYTMVPGQKVVNVEVFQGEAATCSQNRPVGSFVFPLRPSEAGAPVRVEFAYDLNGVVRVSVEQTGTDNAKVVALQVADASQGGGAEAPEEMTAIERRARALMNHLGPADRATLERLLADLAAAEGAAARAGREDAILDFLLDREPVAARGADQDR